MTATTQGPTVVRAAAVAVVVVALAGCGLLDDLPDVPEAPPPVPTDLVPSPTPRSVAPNDSELSPDGFDAAERMAVRVRNIGCFSLSTGSGFAIDPTTLVTNRHVVVDSAQLELSTYDGRDVGALVASTADLADLALVRTSDELPAAVELAPRDPERGETITVIGYPLGGPLTATSGRVIATTTDPLHVQLGEVLVTDAPVEPGSSGSPALDSEGRLAGVVYAMNDAGQSFVVPVSTLREMLEDEGSFVPAEEEPCLGE